MARKKFERLTEREAEVMSLLWEHGPLFIREMMPFYPEPRPHVNTVSTTVRILEYKGYIKHEVLGSSFRYYPIVQASNFASKTLGSVIKNYFRGSALLAVSSLIEEEKLSVDELRQLLEMVEANKK
ncbi:MAG: BlaI/MecI/CopY family transcriptional regulator [Muribaculaceae bacterium]|nr:BlaI/MecI/CopY family transcriptional regulator [Muribaculaceae bacterium]